ncbi:hypothetical protein BJ508DRAFT_308897 [Ascobolus immersus RN42]|uniref:Uncharacterized protein n=1 Tax=Ascobolus immersus RN42 TaxID=1160509 RepID=A0A3N4I080_ASCIM|nr:hypothetical protein BJ508DRAFT_308897 [Ascobolus immersus RN42]
MVPPLGRLTRTMVLKVAKKNYQLYKKLRATATRPEKFIFYENAWLVAVENEDNINNYSTYNALSLHHNPHMVPPVNLALLPTPHPNDSWPAWSEVPRIHDKEVAPNFPHTVEELTAMTLGDWLLFGDFHGWKWRDFVHEKTGKSMTVAFARAKFCVRVGVFHKVPWNLFYEDPDQTPDQSQQDLEDAIQAIGPSRILFPNPAAGNNLWD